MGKNKNRKKSQGNINREHWVKGKTQSDKITQHPKTDGGEWMYFCS